MCKEGEKTNYQKCFEGIQSLDEEGVQQLKEDAIKDGWGAWGKMFTKWFSGITMEQAAEAGREAGRALKHI